MKLVGEVNLKSHFLCGMAPRHCKIGADVSTQHGSLIPEERRPQLQSCENLKSLKERICGENVTVRVSNKYSNTKRASSCSGSY